MKKIFHKILGGDQQSKKLKKLKSKVDAINNFEFKDKSLAGLKKRLNEISQELTSSAKANVDDYLVEVFAITREASSQVLGMRHFDVQLLGGMVLNQGAVSEMRTGEGKTLVATLPVVLNALTKKGVHVVTVNDYLAQRDGGWMGQIYTALGLSLGIIIADNSYIYDDNFSNDEHDDPRFRHLKPCTRQEAYNADITYGTNNEFGFDYLRDNMINDMADKRQRILNFAIVDEVDSILIDEARTPLIISAPSTDSASAYETFASVASSLKPDHYILDEKRRTSSLTDDGVTFVQERLGIGNLYAPENVRLIYHMDQALRAETLFKKNKDYVVTPEGEVIIVDEFTGRLMHGRRYNEGLHQAIEAKEGVAVLQESSTLATISFQNYFRLYQKLSGMTGTAMTEADEFYEIYGLDVIPIPPNMPNARTDKADKVFRTENGKFKALVEAVKELNQAGQPVLIGTASIEKNEQLSKLLAKAGVKHQVLNAKNHESEAAIVAKAGQQGAVTLATNIAGRGTDIVLGEGVKELGGLVVLGSERHEARRIDNQLRGRAGRQGDPGMTQFYVSAEDELMRIFGGERIAALMTRLKVDEDVAIENKAVSKALENAQKKIENQNFDSRKYVVQYDDVMNRQRKAVYSTRQKVLDQEDISELIRSELDQLKSNLTALSNSDEQAASDDFKRLLGLDHNSKYQSEKTIKQTKFSEIIDSRYKEQKKLFGEELFKLIERQIYLTVLDNLWMQHLENMDHLREGINWRSIGQQNPLVEYRREAQVLFDQMMDELNQETIRNLMHSAPQAQQVVGEELETELTRAAEKSSDGFSESQQISTGSSSESSERKALTQTDIKDANKKKRQDKKKKKAARKKGRK